MALIEGEASSESPSEPMLWAALDMKLAAKVKTYWRTVGDSGLPPVFNWTGSANLHKIDILWPAPIRFSDGTGTSIGYRDRVVLPLKVTPIDPAKPVMITLSLDYAVCETLCMPAHYNGSLLLNPKGIMSSGSSRITGSARAENLALINMFKARVPVAVELGGQSPIAVLAIRARDADLILETRWPAASDSHDVFIEGPEGWSFGSPQRLSQRSDPEGFLLATYRVGIDERPNKDSQIAGLDLTATLVSSAMAIETRVTLDKSGQAP